MDPDPDSINPDPKHCRNRIHSSYREERERLTGEKVAQLLCPDEEEVPSQEEAVRYLSLQDKGASAFRISNLPVQSSVPVVRPFSICLSYPLTILSVDLLYRIVKARPGLSKLKSNGEGFCTILHWGDQIVISCSTQLSYCL